MCHLFIAFSSSLSSPLYLFHSHNAVKIRQNNIKTLGMKNDNKARGALTVDPYTTDIRVLIAPV